MLGGLSRGRWDISASLRDWMEAATATVVEITDRNPPPLRIVMGEFGGIRGHVVDSDGAPAAAVHVVLSHSDGISTTEVCRVVTDRRGNFAAEHLRPGDYLFSAEGEAGPLQLSPRADVRAGETAEVTLHLEERGGTISGTVLDAAGAPVRDAEITARREDPERPDRAREMTRYAGWWEKRIRLRPGEDAQRRGRVHLPNPPARR